MNRGRSSSESEIQERKTTAMREAGDDYYALFRCREAEEGLTPIQLVQNAAVPFDASRD